MGVTRKGRLGVGHGMVVAVAIAWGGLAPDVVVARPWVIVREADTVVTGHATGARGLTAWMPQSVRAFALHDQDSESWTLLATGVDEAAAEAVRALPQRIRERAGDGAFRAWLVEEVGELACTPPSTGAGPPFHIRFFPYTVRPARERHVADELAKRAALCRRRSDSASYSVLRTDTAAGESPVYVIAMAGPDAAAVDRAHAALASAFGWRGRAIARALNASWEPLDPVGGVWQVGEGVRTVGAAPVPLVVRGDVAPAEPLPVPAATTVPVAEPVAVAEPLVVDEAPEAFAAAEPEPAAPRPVAAAPSEPSPDPTRVVETIRRWASAWAGRDVEGYLGFYAETFEPSSGRDPEAWRALRRQRLTAPTYIEVRVDGLVAGFDGPGQAWATFVQEYRSDRYSDRVTKRLELVWEEARWRIVREQVLEPET